MIAKAKTGDIILLELSNHMIRRVKLVEIKTYGIEAKVLGIKTKPLRFFPFHNIISIEKDTDQNS
jgi:hypothetical protein